MIVIVLWLVAVAGLQVLHRTYGGEYSDNFSLSDVQSTEGLDVLKEHQPSAGGYSSQIVLNDTAKPLTDLSSQVSTVVANLQKLPDVISVQNPLPPPDPLHRRSRPDRTSVRSPRTA